MQRRTNDLPVLHLEPEVPTGTWTVEVDGMVGESRLWSLRDIHAMAGEKRTWDLNCVWGWTRPACECEGIPGARLLDSARPLPGGRFVLVSSVGDQYASCLTLNRARRSLLAWRLDGADLAPEHGWPLRFVPPPTKWAYKGVKWVSRLTVTDKFTPGMWEGLVGDPEGDVPPEILGHLEDNQREDYQGA